MTAKLFDINNRDLKLNENLIVEASAGTGKTYTIENLAVRLLIEPDPIPIEQLLIVTFTRAATRDLRLRIRHRILESIRSLETKELPLPDYLSYVIEKGEEELRRALLLLKKALSTIDQAQIFTIHGFCNRALQEFSVESGVTNLQNEVSDLPSQLLREIIHDFFRTGLSPSKYHTKQITNAISSHRSDVNVLVEEIKTTLMKGTLLHPQPSYEELFQSFINGIKFIHTCYPKRSLKKELIIADCLELDKCCKKRHKNSNKANYLMEVYARILSQQSWTDDDLGELFDLGPKEFEKYFPDPAELKKGSILPQLCYPDLHKNISEYLLPTIGHFSDPNIIFSSIAAECQKHLNRYIQNEELFHYDSLISCMVKAAKRLEFAESVQKKYRVTLIDEFQDTDELQWDIFRNLFIKNSSHNNRLFLVGDPKQSIYAFRQADIYTYLDAVQNLGEKNKFSLTTNYRSQPCLVEAMNLIFSQELLPGWISLPRLNNSLPYIPVKASNRVANREVPDQKGAIHFFTLDALNIKGTQGDFENNFFFPFIAQELEILISQANFRPDQCAILVQDRYQASRIKMFLKEQGISAISQRQEPLSRSVMLPALREFILATLNPSNISAVKIALGGQLVGWDHTSIQSLTIAAKLVPIIAKFHSFNKHLRIDGFGSFFNKVLESSFEPGSGSISEQLLSQDEGIDRYQELLALADDLIQYEAQTRCDAEALIARLDDIEDNKFSDSLTPKTQPDTDRNAVQILTLHMSKGLEFDIVFCIGLIGHSKENGVLYPKFSKGSEVKLYPINESDPSYLQYRSEIDAEARRKFYVAITRARHRVYIPILFQQLKKNFKVGNASPSELFTAQFGKSHLNETALYEVIKESKSFQFRELITQLETKHSISQTSLETVQFLLTPAIKPAPPILLPSKAPILLQHTELFYSFTSLSKSLHDSTDVRLESTPLRSEKGIPMGVDVGTLIHTLLEKIPIDLVKAAKNCQDLIPFVSLIVDKTILKEWENETAELIFNAWKTPLTLGEEKISLSEIDSDQMLRETEFLYHWSESLSFPEIDKESGFLKGVIDLLFSYNNRYYLIDWKSNWLGNLPTDYSLENLGKTMEHHHYHLQAEIYKNAIKKYLRLFDERPFEDVFGGCFYLFLRGLDPTGSTNYGIFKCGKNNE